MIVLGLPSNAVTCALLFLHAPCCTHIFTASKSVPHFESDWCHQLESRNNQDGYRSNSVSKVRFEHLEFFSAFSIADPQQFIEWCKEHILLSSSVKCPKPVWKCGQLSSIVVGIPAHFQFALGILRLILC